MILVRQLNAEVDRCGRGASRNVIHYGSVLSSLLNTLEDSFNNSDNYVKGDLSLRIGDAMMAPRSGAR
jgi:hypothetical protein